MPLAVSITGDDSTLTAVEFFDGGTSLGTLTEEPYILQTGALGVGKHTFSARLYSGDDYTFTGLVQVTVGDQLPYSGSPIQLPGTFDSGYYDLFQGGLGQGVSYYDSSIGNNNDFRTDEYVDAGSHPSEGAYVGFVADGEWLEYTVAVDTTGIYSMGMRYASGNPAGGGPVYLELDGKRVSTNVAVPSTGDWSSFSTATINNIELKAGVHVLRLNFVGGELDVGRLTFTYSGALGYVPPMADAGDNFAVVEPETTAELDGSASTVAVGKSLTYLWEQIEGPVVANFTDNTAAVTDVSGLTVDGIYRFRLTVDDGTYTDFDTLQVVRGDLAGLPPVVTILSPSNGTSGFVGQAIDVNITASDPDGEVVKVELYDGDTLVGTDTAAPWTFDWSPDVGVHSLTARATDSDELQATSSAITYTVLSNAYSGSPAPIPGLIEAENFDFGGEGVAYHDSDASNNGGGYRPNEAVDIEGDGEGGWNVGWAQPGEWMKYSVDIDTPGVYRITSRVARGTAGSGAFHLELAGVDVTGSIVVENTGGWQNWVNKTNDVTIRSSGEQILRVVIEQADVNLNKFDFALVKALEPAPDLQVEVSGSNVLVSWPSSSNGFDLYGSSNLADWSVVAQAPVIQGDQWVVTIPLSEADPFFRLQTANP